MKINGKEYEINTNIKLGVQRRLKEHPEIFQHTVDFLQNVLIPMPSNDEIDEMGTDDVGDIIVEFERAQKTKNTEFKKKLSR